MRTSQFDRLRNPILLMLALGSAALSGCGGSESSLPGVADGNGTLAIQLADAPAITQIKAVNVTIPKVEALVGNSWVTIASPNKSYNLLNLALTAITLGQGRLAPGSYSQLRLFVSNASVVDDKGTHSVAVPDSAKNGLIVNVGYMVQAGATTNVLLDFNVRQSLSDDGNGHYSLAPVVRGVDQSLTGTLSGFSTDGVKGLPFTGISAGYAAGNSYLIGTQVDVTFSTADGHFRLWQLLPGTYDIELIYFDPVTLSYKQQTFVGFVVQANQDTNVGTCKLPG